VIQHHSASVIRLSDHADPPERRASAGAAQYQDPPQKYASVGTQEHSMIYVVPYVAVLVVFGIIDAAWLNTMGKVLYRPALGDILLDDLRIGPAVAFYLIYPIGIVAFAVLPGLRSDSVTAAFYSALLFGALAYGTYDLTNYATLRNWTLQITLIDICYGALASGIAAIVAMFVARAFTQ
jgi:uncharacterized membrane protein